MQRRALVPIVVVSALIALGVAGPAAAHHSFARFDRCHPVTLAGEIGRVMWQNPHVEFALHSSDGPVYTIIWLNVQQLKRDGVTPDTLRPGDRVEITGAKQPEDTTRVITLVTTIRRTGDGWMWSMPPPAC